ncbi:MAG: glycosyltransferase family 4 protein [Anaerolineales bacterium]
MTFTLVGNICRYDGYGYMNLKLSEVLRRRGGLVRNLAPLKEHEIVLHGPTVVAASPEWLRETNLKYVPEETMLLTMFEADRIPGYWPEILNALAGCIVPTTWNVEVFRRCGVRAPLFTAPLGIDRREYPLLSRPPDERPYTFLWSGTPDRRKGWDLAYRAFRRAFGDSREVRLVLHFREMPDGLQGAQDANVTLIHGRLLHSQWRLLLWGANCFVFPTRGEGWGLPPREAAATGLPAIVTDWSGTAENLEQWGIPLRVARLAPADHGVWEREDLGQWAEPDEEHLVHLLRWCYEHAEEATGIGKRAAAWLATRTWERMADGVTAAVDEVLT